MNPVTNEHLDLFIESLSILHLPRDWLILSEF